MGMVRGSFRGRGPGFTDKAVVIRCISLIFWINLLWKFFLLVSGVLNKILFLLLSFVCLLDV